jgi:hypothetical protein
MNKHTNTKLYNFTICMAMFKYCCYDGKTKQ